MKKKIIVFFIFLFLCGGFFIFLNKSGILSNNSFLASLVEFLSFGNGEKKTFSLSKEEFSSLKEKIAFLEENLEAKEKELENLDDLIEKTDILSQKIIELEAERQEISDQTSEIQEKEEDVQNKEELEETIKEAGQPCQKTQGIQPLKNKVIINEVAWMGTTNSANDEWIELKNISGATINFKNWQLLDKDNQIKIIFSSGGLSSVNGLFLLERTSDDSVPGVAADLIYTGTLSNTNEALYLFDENCQLQDEVLANPDWSAGDNTSKRTMERKSDLTWQTSYEQGGTPKKENSSGYFAIPPATGGGGGSSSSGQQTQPKITLSYPENSPVNKEIEAILSVSDIKSALYDVKISIENEGTVLSEIYNQKENKWQLSFYYLKELFSGDSFEGKFQLRIKEEMKEFRGEADIIVRVRESGKTNYYEFIGKINITDPEQAQNQPPIAFFTFSPQNPFVNEEIIFDASSSTDPDPDGQIISYIWDFGDDNSTTINQATTTHSYSTSTDFTIGLQVIDNEGATSALATSTIFVAEIEVPFSELDVVINEIAWMGTTVSANDEWLELYNNTDRSIDLGGWILKAIDGTPLINLSGLILANSYYLLERTSDDSVPDIPADQIYTGALGNSGEYLQLYDNLNNLIDEINNSGGWFAGNNDTKQTMERINPLILSNNFDNWATSLNPGGTPKSQNSQYVP